MTEERQTEDRFKPITLAQTIEAARRVANRHPNRFNPTLPPSVTGDDYPPPVPICAYTDADDPDWHCFGGSILLELGCRLPPEGMAVWCSPDYDRLDDDDGAGDYLARCQAVADTRDSLTSARLIYDFSRAFTIATSEFTQGDR